MLKTIINWGWCPGLITALAVIGIIFGWPIEAVVPVLILILGIGIVAVVIDAKRKQLELSVLRLNQLADYFNRRFMGNSALSVFAISDSLFGINNPKLWDWARACDVSQRILNSWNSSFTSRLESEISAKKSITHLHTCLNELWAINNHYYEFIDQFHELMEYVETPREITDQYNKLVMKYNAFVQDFRANIGELRNVVKTAIDPPSVKLAKELAMVG
ncbi:hypothetical protein ACFLWZ_00220 [Chloroflexota bacterium]